PGRCPAHRSAQRGCHAAALGIPDQRRHAGWPSEANTNRIFDAAAAEPLEPGDDMLTRERELAYNMNAQALSGRTGDFLVERGFELPQRNARITFRIGANANSFDTDPASITFLDHSQRVVLS